MEQLLNLLEKVKDDSVKGQAFNGFKEIATKLMSEDAIKKGGDFYQMVEIEFYWDSPNHPDLSVYPRKSAAGNWFLHPSGVDIMLQSDFDKEITKLRNEWNEAKKNQTADYSEKSSYGGILIRTLRKLTTENNSEDSKSFIVGPWNCSDALFDYLPCDGNTINISYRPLHRLDHRRQEVRQQSWLHADCHAPERPDRRLDHCLAADARRR